MAHPDPPPLRSALQNLNAADRDRMREAMRAGMAQLADAVLHGSDGDAVFARHLRVVPVFYSYSPWNQHLIWLQAPTTRQVASRTAWNRVARAEGHRGRPEKCPGALHGKVYAAPKPDATRVTILQAVHMRPVRVFAVEDMLYADTEQPIDIPDFVPDFADAGARYLDPLLRFAAAERIHVGEWTLGLAVRGESLLGTILLQAGDPVGKKLAVLCHEIAHELLHRKGDRLLRPRSLLEGEAEATACLVLRYFGCSSVAPSAAYLRRWGIQPEHLVASMNNIVRTAERIVRGIERHTGPAPQ